MASNSEGDDGSSGKRTKKKQKNATPTTRTGKKRGRKPRNLDAETRIAQSRQNARECRARKKLRYQYVEELVTSREKAIFALRQELEMLKQWCISLDRGLLPTECQSTVTRLKQKLVEAESASTSGTQQ